MSSLKLVVFLGSAREGRFGIRVARYIMNLLRDKGHDAELLDPMEIKIPILEKTHYAYGGSPAVPPQLQSIHEKIVAADAYVVVSAEYNHSIPPGLSNMMDHFAIKDYKHKPCGIVCYSYGQFGGVRAAMQLRSFLGELGMVTPHFIFAVPKVLEAFSEDGTPLNEYMKESGLKLVSELEWFGHALKDHTTKFGKPS